MYFGSIWYFEKLIFRWYFILVPRLDSLHPAEVQFAYSIANQDTASVTRRDSIRALAMVVQLQNELPRVRSKVPGRLAKLSKVAICSQMFAKFWRARFRLYRSQIVQVNLRWKAFAEIYTMHSFAPFSTLNFLFQKLLNTFCYFFSTFSKDW